MKFSICHTTARPKEWGTAYAEWMQNAAHPEDVEYVLVVDARWGFTELPKLRAQDKVLWNTDKMCLVGGANVACAAATGDILIINSDDVFPCAAWDFALESSLYANKLTYKEPDPKTDEVVIQTSSDTPADARGLMVCQIFSRARYQRLGYGLYPAYDSMYADDDFSEHARLDGVVIDARHLIFPHKHPVYGHGKMDEVYQHENKSAAYEKGVQILTQRRAQGFRSSDRPLEMPPARKVIAVCLPGIQFSQHWVATWTELFGKLLSEFVVHPIFSYSTNVYATRIAIADMVLKNCSPRPDYVLWIDDDNLVNSLHFRQLFDDLEQHPEYDGIAGWCWVLANVGDSVNTTSVGNFGEDGGSKLWPRELLMAGNHHLQEFECGGFPCFLMRYSALEAVGKEAFKPRLTDTNPYGFCGEDIAFFTAAREAGLRFAVDKHVKVPHLRLGSPEPAEMLQEQQQEQMIQIA
jgi:hypothetical protein